MRAEFQNSDVSAEVPLIGRSRAQASAIVPDEKLMIAVWPAVPLKVRRAFCPRLSVTLFDPALSVPVTSAGTVQSVTVMLPAEANCGSRTISYPPAGPSDFVSRNCGSALIEVALK